MAKARANHPRKPKLDRTELRLDFDARAIIENKAKAACLPFSTYIVAAATGHPIRALHELAIVGEVRAGAVAIDANTKAINSLATAIHEINETLQLLTKKKRRSDDTDEMIWSAVAEYGNRMNEVERTSQATFDDARNMMEVVCNWCLVAKLKASES
jgi:hypothetical protein